ncbi:MAG: PAC2 family protein, partial [Actinobacteria bacterium]|nr:PAC2 family protein [Actinomycetota bacterium]
SLALLRALCDVGGIDVPTGSLAEEASAQKRRIDRLVGQNGEHADMLRQMEEAHDAAEGGLGDSVPSGDQLAAELEQFLREHRSE